MGFEPIDFCPPLLQKRGAGAPILHYPPPPIPLVMTASLYSSKTATTDHGQDHDPEASGKVENANVPIETDGDTSEKGPSPWEVTLEKSEDPKTMVAWYKWAIVFTVSFGAMCVTCGSSMVSATRHIRVGSNAFISAGRFR